MMSFAWMALLLGSVARAAAPCVSSPWVIHETVDLSGSLPPDRAWRLSEIYRYTWDERTRTWAALPVPALPGTPICPGDVVETWLRTQTIIALRPPPGAPDVRVGEPLASVVASGGTVLEFRADIVQRRGTATYLLPDAMPSVGVLAVASGGRWLKVSGAHSTFQVSVGEGCDPAVDVTVSGDDDPWAMGVPVQHQVTVEVLDSDGERIGAPVTVKAGQVRRLRAGNRRTEPVEAAAEIKAASAALKECSAAVREPLSERSSPPPAEAWPRLQAQVRLRVEGAARPEAVMVDGAVWAPGAWWRVRDDQGARVWEAARGLVWTPGVHQVVVERRGADDLVWQGEGAAGPGEQVLVLAEPEATPAVVPTTPEADRPPVPVTSTTAAGGPTGETWTTSAIPGAPMTFIALSGGTFLMGRPAGETGDADELPQHTVTVSGFSMAKSEVTQAQWAAVVRAAQAKGDRDATSLNIKPSNFTGDTLPVEQVSWCDAARFANALSRLEDLTPAYTVGEDCENGGDVAWDPKATGYRLPTEAEWEYAARAGTSTAYATGDAEADLARAGWYGGNSGSKTHPVCTAEVKPWGLCDLHGNVWEWTWDGYGEYSPDNATNPRDPSPSAWRVIRGGSWYVGADLARAAGRYWDYPSGRYLGRGLRLVLPSSVPGPPAGP